MKNVRRLLLALFIAATLTGTFAGPSAYAATVAPPVFAEEFDAAPLDTKVWAATTPWNGLTANGEYGWYEPGNLSFTGGNLRITTEKRRLANGYDYASGIITSGSRVDFGGADRRSFRYGYFEMRARLPKGQGVWPAFWLTNDRGWEIDVFEVLGHDPRTVHMTLHRLVNGAKTLESKVFTGPDFSAGYHTFAVDWQPAYVRWYVDGVLRAETTGNIPSDPLWIVANTAVGGPTSWSGAPDATTVFPQNYDIDYIRVFRTMADAAPLARVKRISGPDRYSTAAAISSQSFTSAEAVVIATGRDYADALAAAPLAGVLDAPVLLVPGMSIPTAVGEEIARLGAKRAFVVGGQSAVDDVVADSLRGMGLGVERVAGGSRYATAAAIAARALAEAGRADADTVFVVRGDGFADALSVSSAAYGTGFPVLLALPDTLPADTVAAVRELRPRRIVIVGGTPAISAEVAAQLRELCPDVTRVSGATRYGTSAEFAGFAVRQGWSSPALIGMSTGTAFPDALGGGAAAGSKGGLLLLTAPDTLSAEARTFIEQQAAAEPWIHLYGGLPALGSEVESSVRTMAAY